MLCSGEQAFVGRDAMAPLKTTAGRLDFWQIRELVTDSFCRCYNGGPIRNKNSFSGRVSGDFEAGM